MHLFISIDDTDNLESPGTGAVAEEMAALLSTRFNATCTAVSRHQLFFNEAIPYTSHNSAMCFEAEVADVTLAEILPSLQAFLAKTSAPGSDPGLCVLVKDKLRAPQRLIDFGKRAKQEVLSKAQAYHTAKQCGVHLSEHGGTGLGVIGALAGVGLRLDGNDGRYKGWMQVGMNQDNMLVEALLSHRGIDQVMTVDGCTLTKEDEVFITDRVKTVRVQGQSVLLVEEVLCDGRLIYRNLSKNALKKLSN